MNIQYQSKVWTEGFSRVFLYFYYFLHCRMSLKLWNKTWNHIVTKKVLNTSKYIWYFIFFNVATLCLDNSFAHSWRSLNQLHLERFFNSLEGVPTCAEHLLAAFPSLYGPTHPKPSQLGWGQVIMEARSSDAALHHSPSWSNSPFVLHSSRWEPQMQRSSIHLLCVSQRHGGWNQNLKVGLIRPKDRFPPV